MGTKTLDFYLTSTQTCLYLPERQSTHLLTDPRLRANTRIYSFLIDYGFRRSGAYIYRPHCEGCTACIPVRLPVVEFKPRRIHRRILRRNRDVRVHAVSATYHEQHFQLYQRYLMERHGGGVENPEHYLHSMIAPDIDTGLYEFRTQDRLLAVAVVDHLAHGLSAVYTFYDPEEKSRSLGTLAILWQISEAQRRGLRWLYLGYWIKECPRMSYKNQYRPFEIYRDDHWFRIDSAAR